MDKQQLKPCPFCGHDTPEFERLGTSRQSCIVVCGNCGCQHESSDEGAECGTSWNDRAPQPPSASDERETVRCDCPGGTKAAALHAPNCQVRLRDAVLVDPYDGGTWVAPSPGVDAAEQKPCAYRRWDDSNSRWHFTLWPEEEQQFEWSPVFAAPSHAASADEWMAEFGELLNEYAAGIGSCCARVGKASLSEAQKQSAANRAALLAHLKARP